MKLILLQRTFLKFIILLLIIIFASPHAIATSIDSTSFITTWKTDNPGGSGDNQITIPTTNVGYNYDVDWNNDGIFDTTGLVSSITHTFPSIGTHTIRIKGNFPTLNFDASNSDSQKLISVDQWGTIPWTSMYKAFYNCINLNINATDAPNLSLVTNMNRMFLNCSSMNQDFNNWDVSNVTDMQFMFMNCYSFNGNISSWNVSNVNNMSKMFYNCSSFNENISTWDISNVTQIESMFEGCSSFNQDISSWDISNISNMLRLFQGCTNFNQNIGSWDMSNANKIQNMFTNCTNFNQDLSNWDVSNITSLFYTFGECTSFNQDISNWNVSNVTDMGYMFINCPNFNQDISNWDVSKVTRMDNMFKGCSNFNQNLGNWIVSQTWDMQHMFSETNLSTENYDSLLIGWSNLNLKHYVNFDVGNNKYCLPAAVTARNILDIDFHWTITDGGQTNDCLVSIDENYQGTLEMCPNPTNSHVNLVLRNSTHSTLTITDATGRLLESIHLAEGLKEFQLDVSKYTNGLYLIQVFQKEKNIQSNRLVIQN